MQGSVGADIAFVPAHKDNYNMDKLLQKYINPARSGKIQQTVRSIDMPIGYCLLHKVQNSVFLTQVYAFAGIKRGAMLPLMYFFWA